MPRHLWRGEYRAANTVMSRPSGSILLSMQGRVGLWCRLIASGEWGRHGAVGRPPSHRADGCSGNGHDCRGLEEPQYCKHGRSGYIYALRWHSPEGLMNLNTGAWASRMHLSVHRRGWQDVIVLFRISGSES